VGDIRAMAQNFLFFEAVREGDIGCHKKVREIQV
jgi:hypothetical protein